MTKEDKDYVKRAGAVDSFLVDDSSSDENMDCNMDIGGVFTPLDSCNSPDLSIGIWIASDNFWPLSPGVPLNEVKNL